MPEGEPARARTTSSRLAGGPSVASSAPSESSRLGAPKNARPAAVVTADVHPESVVMPAGWDEANPNLLISNAACDPISAFPALRSGGCRLESRKT